jgi:hypothetical protein
MDLVSLFAIVVFGASWFFLERTPDDEPLVRLFFQVMMFLGAAIGFLGVLLRWLT